MKKYASIYVIIILLAITIIPFEIFAQCPMCKMAAESDMRAGGTAGKGLNTGILYLLAMPYLLLGLMFYYWRKKNAQTPIESDFSKN